MQVTIIDTRADWMKQEDKAMKCYFECPLFWKCSSKHGWDCKRFGGDRIPKVRYPKAR